MLLLWSFAQAHAVMCKHLGPEDQGSLETLQWLAYAYQKKGDVAEARRSLQVVFCYT